MVCGTKLTMSQTISILYKPTKKKHNYSAIAIVLRTYMDIFLSPQRRLLLLAVLDDWNNY